MQRPVKDAEAISGACGAGRPRCPTVFQPPAQHHHHRDGHADEGEPADGDQAITAIRIASPLFGGLCPIRHFPFGSRPRTLGGASAARLVLPRAAARPRRCLARVARL